MSTQDVFEWDFIFSLGYCLFLRQGLKSSLGWPGTQDLLPYPAGTSAGVPHAPLGLAWEGFQQRNYPELTMVSIYFILFYFGYRVSCNPAGLLLTMQFRMNLNF